MSEKKNGISIANILAMLGLAGLGVLSFFGLYFKSPDANLSMPILLAVAIVVGLALFLILMIKAKGAKDNPDKWRIVEWICLVLYLGLAVVCAKPTLHFFHVLSQKEALQQQAWTELAACDELYSVYDQWKEEALANAAGQFQNYIDSPQYAADLEGNELHKYVVVNVQNNPSKWMGRADEIVSLSEDARIKDLRKRVGEWKLVEIPKLSMDLVKTENAAWKRVADKLDYCKERDLIPVVVGGPGEPYALDGLAKFEIPEQVAPAFSEGLKVTGYKSVLGWVILVVLHLLILLNYLVAPRCTFVGPAKNTRSNGLDL